MSPSWLDHVEWIGQATDGDECSARVGRLGRELVAEFFGLGVLRAERDGSRSSFVPNPDASHLAVDKLKKDMIAALLRHLRGSLTLHGGAVAWEGRAAGLIGSSGAGKSTLVAACWSCAGAGLLGDDTIAIELSSGHESPPSVLSTQRESWLMPAAFEALGFGRGCGKQPVSPTRVQDTPARLIGLVSLRFDPTLSRPQLSALRGTRALAAVIPSVVRFVIDEPDRQSMEFDQLMQIVDKVRIYELARPPGFEHLVATANLVRDLVWVDTGRPHEIERREP